MLMLYSGTPGSGKSLHTAERIYSRMKFGFETIGNFPINENKIKGKIRGSYTYVPNKSLDPKYLIKYSKDYFKRKKMGMKESQILLIIDECQLMFNAREWNVQGRAEWLSFFTQHRHYGYDIILACQFDRMIDRQIRSLIEYEFIHRKVSNFGIFGLALKIITLGDLFVSVKVWYPMKERVGSEFFKARKKYYRIYDTFTILDMDVPVLNA